MKLVSLGSPLLSLDLTLNSGQAFHWRRLGEGWVGAIGEIPAYLEQRDGELRVNAEAAAAAADYLALDHPLEAIYASFPKDELMQKAAQFCSGMRILRQPKWEALATFITSSMKQVAHIAAMSHALRGRYGRALSWNGHTVYAYPAPGAIAALEAADLRDCSLGYRAGNLLQTARMVASGEVDLEKIGALPDDEARKALCALPGVGEKVANCALLFGFERLRAFPVDVWIARILREGYFPRRRKVTPGMMREFGARYFGPFGGYAQQLLFHHARLTSREK